jgi:hypothetical protein
MAEPTASNKVLFEEPQREEHALRRLIMEAIPGIPLIRIHQDGRNRSEHSRAPSDSGVRHFVRRLKEKSVHEARNDSVRALNLLVDAGLSLAEGAILGEEAHREFMEQSGLWKDLRAATPGSGEEDAGSKALRIRFSHRQSPIKGELSQEIFDALIEIGAPWVIVISEGLIRRGLGSIPEVKDAIREAWLSPEGLRRQLQAAFRGEGVPTWPVVILAENVAG